MTPFPDIPFMRYRCAVRVVPLMPEVFGHENSFLDPVKRIIDIKRNDTVTNRYDADATSCGSPDLSIDLEHNPHGVGTGR